MSQDLIPAAILTETNKQIVEARFHLTEVKAFQLYGDSGYRTAKAVNITMQAAKAGIFGKTSPQGRLELMIANPGRFAVFETAFNQSVRDFFDGSRTAPKIASNPL